MSFCTSLSTRQRQMTCTPTALDDHCLVFSYGIQVLWMCRLNKTHVLWLRNSRFGETRCWQAIETYYDTRLQLVCTTYLLLHGKNTHRNLCQHGAAESFDATYQSFTCWCDKFTSTSESLNAGHKWQRCRNFRRSPAGQQQSSTGTGASAVALKFNIRQLQHWKKQIKRS